MTACSNDENFECLTFNQNMTVHVESLNGVITVDISPITNDQLAGYLY